MKIVFNPEWNQNTIKSLVSNNCYLNFGTHEDLKALCIIPYAEDEETVLPDYQELTYIVPKKWLRKVAKKLFGVTNMEHWLQNEYTSDQSEIIFARALNERQVVVVDFL